MNLRTLYNNAKDISDYRSHYRMPGDPYGLVEVMPNLNNNTMCFVFDNTGITEPTNHLTFIAFRNTHFITNDEFESQGLSEDDHYSFSYEGNLYWAKKHKMTNTVKVNCSCSDFYFTFAFYNWKTQTLFGKKPIPYVRKTTSRPPRNPEHKPGICKHIYWNLIELYELGIMSQVAGL